MSNYLRSKLGIKFVVLVVAILSTTLGLNATFSLKQQQTKLEEHLVERGRTLSHFASRISREAILSYDFIALDDYVKDVTKHRDIIFGVVLDTAGNPLTSYIDKSKPDVKAFTNSRPVNSIAELLAMARKSPDIIFQRFPITNRGETLGEFVVGISRARLESELTNNFIRQIMVYGLIILFLSTAIYFVFHYSVLLPVRELMLGSRRIADGNYRSPARVLSSDELGELTETFNNMMEDVRHDREMLNFQANYDSLTGLPNRLNAMDSLTREIARSHRHKTKFSLIFIDLNNFKFINDSMGHLAGDSLLISLSRRFTSVLRESDMIARLGGDEFLVVLPNTGDPEEARDAANRLADALTDPLVVEGREVYLQCSMGITIYPDNGTTTEALMANADNAMYQAKLATNDDIQFFAPEMNRSVEERLELEHDLHVAVQQHLFELHYQPIIDVSTRKIIGAEALIRWRHPTKGLIFPDVFIPLAEATGKIIPIGSWVLQQAAQDGAQLISQGIDPGYFAVNVSRVQLTKDFSGVVRKALADSGLSPHYLRIEITESALMEQQGSMRDLLYQMCNDGTQLILDDFGTGFSSLSYLKHFPFDVLKIDKSFINGVPHVESDASLVRGIVAMGKSLGIRVVAEGVEQEEQMDFLTACEVDAVQGYLFARPMPLNEYVALLRNDRSA